MMNPMYESNAYKLVDRIEKLIPDHPEILQMDDPFKLFKVEGFKCSDLDLSLFQAGWALQEAKRRWKDRQR